MRLTEKEIIDRLWNSTSQYTPLAIEKLKEEPPMIREFRPDVIVEVSLSGKPSFKALIEIVSVPSPKVIAQKCRQLLEYIGKLEKADLVPLIVAPYIGSRQADILAAEKVSWIDLCGNMLLDIPGKTYIERTGKPNKFPDSSPIKKIFQRTSSLVSRALLLQPEGFSSQYEIVDFINNRKANITISTVSRVLKSLEEELLVNKTKSLISVIDAEKLLDRLAEAYENSIRRSEVRTYRFAADNFERVWSHFFVGPKVEYTAYGFYAAKLKGLTTTDEIQIYVKDIEQAKKVFQLTSPDAEFGNLILTETKDPGVWFNVIQKEFMPVVDDIELYLEMITETPRGPKIAQLLKQRILKINANG